MAVLLATAGCSSGNDATVYGGSFTFTSPGGKQEFSYPADQRHALDQLSGPDLTGTGTVSLSDYAGKVVVLNVWGSWCAPCVAEFGLFGTASAYYGKRVAFVGAEVGDSASDGRSFMQQHPVSYPSYQTSAARLTSIVPQGLLGTPTTIFIDRAGKIAYVHTGQYLSQGTLDSDIAAHALPG